MKINPLFAVLTVAFMVFTAEKGMADEVWLKNGDHITGKLVRLENNQLIFNTSYAGEISIKWEEIANFRTETAVTVVLSDATSAKGFISPGEEGTVIVKSEQIKEPFTVELASFKMINPSPPRPPLKVKARVNFGANISKGNTDTENIYGDGEFVARTKKSRYTLGGSYKRSEDNNQKTADSVKGYTKYDYFLSEKWYLFANATGEKDEFKDLNLRTAVGPGVGYQFLETEITNLALEAGLNYVNEDFIAAEDEDYAAGRWALKFDRYFFDKRLQFFHAHDGFISLEDSDDIFVLSQTGLRFPFSKHLNATAQFNYDWDNAPSPGREREDKTYIFTIGYQWENSP